MFQFGRGEKTGASLEEGGVPSFIGVCSSLEDVKKRERGSFFHWGMFQFGRREKTGGAVEGGAVEGGGVPSFIGVCSSSKGVKKRVRTVISALLVY